MVTLQCASLPPKLDKPKTLCELRYLLGLQMLISMTMFLTAQNTFLAKKEYHYSTKSATQVMEKTARH